MSRAIASRLAGLLGKTPIAYLPVRVRAGMARGARWTMFPHTGYWRGNTETDVDSALARVPGLKGAACWDVGTHFGIYTVGMAMAVGETGQVVGFEPDPISFARCAYHVRLNSLTWVKLFQAAASDRDGTAGLVQNRGQGATTSHLPYQGEPTDGTERPIQTLRLDGLVERGEVRPPRLIKIDVEGHGASMLVGARETIERHGPAVVMSFHCPEEVDGAIGILKPAGYAAEDCYRDERRDWPDTAFRGTLLFRRM